MVMEEGKSRLLVQVYFRRILEAEASSPISENKFFEEPKSTELSTPSSSLEFQAHFGMVRIEGIRIAYDTTPLCEAIKSSLNQVYF